MSRNFSFTRIKAYNIFLLLFSSSLSLCLFIGVVFGLNLIFFLVMILPAYTAFLALKWHYTTRGISVVIDDNFIKFSCSKLRCNLVISVAINDIVSCGIHRGDGEDFFWLDMRSGMAYKISSYYMFEAESICEEIRKRNSQIVIASEMTALTIEGIH